MFPFPFSFISGAAPDVPVERIANAEAMSFNGVDAYINVGTMPALPADFTWSAWINPKRINDTYEMIYTQGTAITGGASSTPYLAIKDTRLHLFITGVYETGLNFITADEWQHVVATRTNGVLNLYRNGVEYNGARPTQSGTINTNNPGVIGKWYNSSHYFKGSIDEVAIFNTALSPEKITQIYDATAVVGGVPQTANLFTGGLDSSLVYWNRMGDS